MKRYILMIAFLTALVACQYAPESREAIPESEVEAIETSSENDTHPREVTVALINQNRETIGEAILTETDTGIQIDIEAEQLPPGAHGFHIHEKGLCEAENKFESAGGHFNPFHKEHGTLNPKGPHAGDLPNIIVQNDGTVVDTIHTDLVTLKKSKVNSLLKTDGTSLIIHANPDDYQTDPAGNAGERIACGVIK